MQKSVTLLMLLLMLHAAAVHISTLLFVTEKGICIYIFTGIPESVTSIVHLCCGYPSYRDQNDYLKADKTHYEAVGQLLDESGIHQVSIEDAEAQNDLERLLPNFKRISVILGSVAIARSKIEDFETLKARIEKALKFIDSERLILAPDCGLGFLTEEQIMSKLEVMVRVANAF